MKQKILVKDKSLFGELKTLGDKEKYQKLIELHIAGDERIPTLEALDHIEETETEITFVDVGCNKSSGWISDNTFSVRE